MSVVTDVVSYLATLDIVDGSSDWPSVRGVLHDGSDQLVAIRNDGGGLPEIGADAGLGSAAFRDPRVHLTIRGAPHDRDGAEDKAQEVYDALHGLMATTLGSTEYHRIVAETTPIEVGQDENARPIHTVAFRLAVAQGAPA
jgi:hypothetical protein